ncbi:histidine phosphatase family protein [Kozakia baliensis]|uniref:Phosphoglycerate mutase n=2 Tax=Kozakia baliensis TaxID=153496 RepID=A0A1D8UW00_9PROT|nr:histidine phosphatase family protein [Kozakia baliensis]AOX17800.1 phosphoglycerate mutase [Kozakia baliensis]GBR33684.1 phosphoglycerate mutase [Kozakia baliensis NRIC 0488]GEL64879.1 phosphoglycerate mutase [Kozakia baliensis]
MLIQRPFWYLRHGQTDWNAQNLSQGRTDIPLNATGEAQAVKAGASLARHWRDGVTPIARIVSSPLVRALRTAEAARDAIAQASGVELPLTTDAGLEEVCFGVKEGQPMGDWYDPWIAGEYTPDGCEPFDELKHRATTAVNRALEGEGLPLIVAHGALFRSLRAAMGLPINVRLANAVPLYITPHDGKWELQAFE